MSMELLQLAQIYICAYNIKIKKNIYVYYTVYSKDEVSFFKNILFFWLILFQLRVCYNDQKLLLCNINKHEFYYD